MIRVPKFCLCCGSSWSGGCACPGEEMEEGRRVFFECGASMSYQKIGENSYSILFKNCQETKDLKWTENYKGLIKTIAI